MKAHYWRRCPVKHAVYFGRVHAAYIHSPSGVSLTLCPTCRGHGKIRVRKPERVCRPNPDAKFTRHWNIRAGKRGMKASVAFQKIGKK